MADDIVMKDHWENVYQNKSDNEVSWYQENPATSLQLIASLEPATGAAIIDVGGGNSNLTAKLLERGFTDLTVLDISAAALKGAQSKLGRNAAPIQWIVSDVLALQNEKSFDIWHDRAVFHFIRKEEEIKRYAQVVSDYVKPGGYFIISTFSLSGPKKCSGLEISRYSAPMLEKVFETGFSLCKSFEEVHTTPFNTEQNFTWCLFRRK